MRHHLSLLGSPQLQTPQGDLLDFPVGKPLALFSYLALEDREVRRDELARIFWPDSPPDRARHSVRQAIWLIRRKLGEEVIQGDDPVSISPDALSLDVRAFHRALGEGGLDHARRLWRGPLLSQLSLAECRSWEHWREEQRGLTVRKFFQGLLEEGRRLSEEGKAGDALAYLSEALELNPHSLEARILQTETLLEAREVVAAGQALDEARREARDGRQKEEVLDRLEERLEEIRKRSSADAPERLGESVEFVGRRGELGDLRGLWKRVAGGRAGVACILGPTGVGKTRISEEFLAGVEESGGVVARAKGYRGEHRIPWGVVADLVRQLMILPGAKGIGSGSEMVIGAMLPSLAAGSGRREKGGREAEAGRGDLNPAALADAVLDMVEAIGFEGPVAIFVDDWQWVDKESRALLGKVMRRVTGLPCLFLLAERTGERRLWQEGAEDLIREATGRVVSLKPLDREELGELLGLLARFSDPRLMDRVVDRIHRVTGGNPLFVGEVLRKLAEEGIYRWEDGGWVLAVEALPAELDLPESVQELIRERLERLSASGAQLAAALAGERRSVPVGLLRRRSGLDEAVFTRAMGELLDREVVEWVGPKEVDFTHDQLRDGAARFRRAAAEKGIPRWLKEHPGTGALAILGTVTALVLTAVWGFGALAGGGRAGAMELLDRPFGDGRLVVLGDSIRELVPPRYRGEEWRGVESSLTRPPNAVQFTDGPFRTPAGEIRWFGEYMGVEEPPLVVEYLEGGRDTLAFRGPGDDVFLDLGPDGGTFLLTTEDPSAGSYRRNLVLLFPGEARPRILYEPSEITDGGDWSPDGRKIVTAVFGAVDTLVVLDPSGGESGRWVFPGFRTLQHPQWCGGSRYVLFSANGPDPSAGFRLDTETGELSRFGEGFLAVHRPVCLGVDWAVAYLGIGEDGVDVYVEDLGAGRRTKILSIPQSETVILRWLPHRTAPPVWEVEITGGPRTLEWSRQDTVTARVRLSDGSPAEAPVEWTSSRPGVASVNGQGIITANGVGSAFVMAEAAGWIRDSIPVVVEEARALPDEVLFRETFQDRGLGAWEIPDSTFPHPRVVEAGGHNLLFFPGDGRYRDFIESREAFSLQYGATLELEVRLPLTRMDRQRFGLCLKEVRPEAGGRGYGSTGQAFCAQYPTNMLSKFRDDVMVVSGAPKGVRYEVDVSRFLPTEAWVHVALQVRPDGIGSLLLEREPIFETPYVIQGHASSLWKILLDGAAVDTELHFRDVTLWRGVRY